MRNHRSVIHPGSTTEFTLQNALSPAAKRALLLLGLAVVVGWIGTAILWRWSFHDMGKIAALIPIACGLCTAVIALLLLAVLIMLALRGRVVIDDDAVTLVDNGRSFRFAHGAIDSIGVVTLAKHELSLDVEAESVGSFLTRAPICVLRVYTSEGAIDFFKSWRRSKLDRLADWIASHVDLVRDDALREVPVGAIATDTSRRARRWLSLLCFATCALIVAMVGPEMILGFRSRTWERTPAVLESVRWSDHTDEEDNRITRSYISDVTYGYDIHGEHFTSNQIGFGQLDINNDVEELAKGRPIGSPLVAFVNPTKPSEAVLFRGPGWFILVCPLCALPALAAGLFLLIKYPTAAQDELLSRYRVRIGAVAPPIDADDSGESVRWTISESRHVFEIDRDRRKAVWMIVRMLLCAGALSFVCMAWLRPMAPELPWGWIVLIVSAFALYPFVAMYLLLLRIGDPPWYRISSLGIHLPVKERPLIRWDWIDSFAIESSSPFAPYRTLLLHRKSGVTRRVPLPDDDESAVASVREHLPERMPLAKYRGLRTNDWLIGAFLSTGTLLIGSSLLEHMDYVSKQLLANVVIGLLFVGPGTLQAIMLHGRRSTDARIMLALSLNMLTTLAAVLLVVIHKI